MIQGRTAEESDEITIMVCDEQVDGGHLAIEVIREEDEIEEAKTLVGREVFRAEDDPGEVEIDNLAEGVWNFYFGMYSKWYHF